jgi:hypothetical protein
LSEEELGLVFPAVALVQLARGIDVSQFEEDFNEVFQFARGMCCPPIGVGPLKRLHVAASDPANPGQEVGRALSADDLLGKSSKIHVLEPFGVGRQDDVEAMAIRVNLGAVVAIRKGTNGKKN